MKLICFIGFHRSSYLVLFTILLCMILMFFFKQVLFIINLINNLGLKLVNSFNWGLNFPTPSYAALHYLPTVDAHC